MATENDYQFAARISLIFFRMQVAVAQLKEGYSIPSPFHEVFYEDVFEGLEAIKRLYLMGAEELHNVSFGEEYRNARDADWHKNTIRLLGEHERCPDWFCQGSHLIAQSILKHEDVTSGEYEILDELCEVIIECIDKWLCELDETESSGDDEGSAAS